MKMAGHAQTDPVITPAVRAFTSADLRELHRVPSDGAHSGVHRLWFPGDVPGACQLHREEFSAFFLGGAPMLDCTGQLSFTVKNSQPFFWVVLQC